MVRNRKTASPSRTTAEVMRRAVKSVLEEGKSARQVSKNLNIPRTTLLRYLDLARSKGIEQTDYSKTNATRQVFTKEQEDMLLQYLLTASKHHHGLTPKQARDLAWQFAKTNRRVYPKTWDETECAGQDWLYGFMKRQPRLSCRKPEATSLSRGTSFNRKNVNDYFDNLQSVMSKHSFVAKDIWNIDETGLTTVHKPPKVLADKKARQVGQVTSAERGVLVTMVGCVSASGGTIPPLLIFPRVNFKPHMLIGAPPGTVGAANPSGWISSDLFITWLKHFIDHTRPCTEKPVLLLMDNHDSHLSIEAISLAKENGVVLLTFPPHCSHKLQPLDISVYGPLKRYFNDATNSWHLEHPGETVSIYQIAGLLGKSFPRAMTISNITSGFRKPGISPYDRNAFGDDDFLAAFVTDRPDPTQLSPRAVTTTIPSNEPSNALINEPSNEPSCSYSDITISSKTPEQLRPYPKAGPRKTTAGRKRRSTAVVTDTPVKAQLEKEVKERQERKQKPKKRRVSRV